MTCHAVGPNGVPVQLKGTEYYEDYHAAVVLMHLMRDEDYALSLEELLAKYPYADAKAVVERACSRLFV